MARKLRTKKSARIRSPESDRGTAVRPDHAGLPAVPASRPEADEGEWKLVCLTQLAEGVPPRSIGQPLRNSNRGSLHLNPANQSSPSHRKPHPSTAANPKSNVGLKPDHPLRPFLSSGHTLVALRFLPIRRRDPTTHLPTPTSHSKLARK